MLSFKVMKNPYPMLPSKEDLVERLTRAAELESEGSSETINAVVATAIASPEGELNIIYCNCQRYLSSPLLR
jgi:hypothetical protein